MIYSSTLAQKGVFGFRLGPFHSGASGQLTEPGVGLSPRTAQYGLGLGRACWELIILAAVAVGCAPPQQPLTESPEPAGPSSTAPAASGSGASSSSGLAGGAAAPQAARQNPPELLDLPAVTVPIGPAVQVPVRIQRSGNAGQAPIEVKGLPEGLTARSDPIADGQSQGLIELTATEPLGAEDRTFALDVAVRVGSHTLTKQLQVTVPRLVLPAFAPMSAVVLAPGERKTVKVSIQRNGVTGALSLAAEAPEKISAQVTSIPDGADSTEVTVQAAADAREGSHRVTLKIPLHGRSVVGSLPVQVERFAFRIRSFMAVVVKPGEQKSVKIPIERRSYQGTIRLQVQHLPQGVTVAPVEVPPGAHEAEIVLVAAPQAEEQVRSVVVTAEGGGTVQSDAMVVRVSYGETGFLPREIVFDPNKAPLLRRGSFGGRLDTKSKQALLKAYGGTDESEAAVLRGLRWLAAHQMADGGWSLKHYHEGLPECDCHTAFEDEVDDNDIAATALAILPMLGAGITHKGAPEEPAALAEFQDAVEKGLIYLMSKQNKDAKSTNHGYFGGGMYAHALATMAMCEAYGLSRDDRLRIPTQVAVKYLADSQHAEGGWRYGRGAPGDLSVTSWVFFAIRSAQSAGLPWPRTTLQKAEKFVTTCAAGPQEAPLTRYAYLPGEKDRLSMTAAGLLTRQFLGWPQNDNNLITGCRYVAQHMPDESSSQLGPIYFYHYATQLLHNMEGPEFDLWNHRMREHLLRTQETGGHRRGSWDPSGADHGKRGGRIYATSMALLTLEVYYRHLPYYRRVVTGAQ